MKESNLNFFSDILIRHKDTEVWFLYFLTVHIYLLF